MAKRSPVDIGAAWKDGRAVDRAVNAAFYEAVRRHRQAGVPILVRKDGRPVEVSPFDIPLPEDERQAGAAD